MMSSELATQGTCCSDNVTIKHLQGSLRFLLFIPSVTALSVPHTQHILSSCSVDAFVINCQIEPILLLLGGELSSSSPPNAPASLGQAPGSPGSPFFASSSTFCSHRCISMPLALSHPSSLHSPWGSHPLQTSKLIPVAR